MCQCGGKKFRTVSKVDGVRKTVSCHGCGEHRPAVKAVKKEEKAVEAEPVPVPVAAVPEEGPAEKTA